MSSHGNQGEVSAVVASPVAGREGKAASRNKIPEAEEVSGLSCPITATLAFRVVTDHWTSLRCANTDISPTTPAPTSRSRKTREGNTSKDAKAGVPVARMDTSNITTPSNTPLADTGAPLPRVARKAEPKKPVVRTATTATKGSKRKKKLLVTPREYAQLITKAVEETASTSKLPSDRALSGMRIYYYGADYNLASEGTQRRMDIVCHLLAVTRFSRGSPDADMLWL